MSEWLRVFEHELARRRRIAAENSDLYRKIHSLNPKGLLTSADCKVHVWVPASHLMIHDGGAKSIKLGGLSTRGFREASPYHRNEDQVVPQMCWRCDATRERVLDLRSAEERLIELKASRPKKQRGRKTVPVDTVFDDLFGEL